MRRFTSTGARLRRPITPVDTLVAQAAHAWNVSATDVRKSAATRASWARFQVWHELRQRTPPVSFPAIGKAFGLTRSSVVAGVRKFEGLLAKSAEAGT